MRRVSKTTLNPAFAAMEDAGSSSATTKPNALAAEHDLLVHCKRLYEEKLQRLQVRHALHTCDHLRDA